MFMNRGRRLIVAARQNAHRACKSTHFAPIAPSINHFKPVPVARTYVSSHSMPPEQHQKKIQEEIADLIDPDALPPVEVTEATVRCDGDILKGLGHPAEFIRTNYEKPERCKYCGVRFLRVHGSHH